MKKLKLLLSLSVALGLVGCSMGHDELEKLCKKDAGTIIYKQVEAEGLYYESCDGVCWLNMIPYGFSYIEMYNSKNNHTYLPGKGLWRIYISSSDDALCHARITKAYNFGDLPEGKCFAAKKKDKVTARYKHSMIKSLIRLDDYNQSKIGRYVYQIIDQRNGEVVSETVDYLLGRTGSGGPYPCKSYSENKGPIKNLFRSTFI